MVIKRIRVRYRLKAKAEHKETIDRVVGMHADKCPVARTLKGCVAIETSLELEAPDPEPSSGG